MISHPILFSFFFFNDTATTEIYTLSLHDALPICTHMVRTGVLRVFGANLRDLLAHSMSNRFSAALSGLGVTALVQSSTATSLMTSAFVGQGLISLPAALEIGRASCRERV